MAQFIKLIMLLKFYFSSLITWAAGLVETHNCEVVDSNSSHSKIIFTFIGCKIVLSFEKTKINEKEPVISHFK